MFRDKRDCKKHQQHENWCFHWGPGGRKCSNRLCGSCHQGIYQNLSRRVWCPESITSAQNKSGYPFLVNIDGQAVLWTEDGKKETTPLYDEKGYKRHDPDAGVGIKYRLQKKVRLSAGLQKIIFGLLNKDYLSEFKVSLNEGESPVLEFQPQYSYKSNKVHIPTFLKGIDRYEAIVNGHVVRAIFSDYGSYAFKIFLPTS